MTTTAPFVVRGPLQGQGAQAEAVMRALPGWFGVEESINAYAKAADEGPTHVAEAQGTVIGFVTLPPQVRPPSKCSSWRCWRAGTGAAWAARSWSARPITHARRASLLHVKTLAPDDPDPGYAGTRAFYQALGFVPLEVLPEVWGPANPCLILVRPLKGGPIRSPRRPAG